jgi:hypothetical protein
LENSHFEIYTTNSEEQARQALRIFEQVRYFFLQKSKAIQPAEGRVRIIAFSSDEEYRPYRLNSSNFAYYERSRKRDYIAMQDLDREHYEAAVHEYTHLILEHLQIALPLWLNEGLADVYSSLEVNGEKAMVGKPLVSRCAVLAGTRWMDWNTLFAVDHDSAYYNEADKASIFYAQSLALTHMLMLGDSYASRFPQFLSAVSSGLAAPQVFERVYGKTTAEVGRDLHAYMLQSTLKVSIENIKLNWAEVEPEVLNLPDFKVNMALADLLALRPASYAEARLKFLTLQKEQPGNAEIDEALGYLAWRQNDVEATRMHFAAAARNGSQDPEVLFLYAQLELSAHGPAEKVLDLLKRVTALQPENNAAKLLLMGVATNQKHSGFALSVARQIHTVKPEEAFRFLSLIAFCYADLQDSAHAEAYAQKALAYAGDAGQRMQINGLIGYLERAKKRRTPSTAGGAQQKASHDSVGQALF